MFSKTQIEAVNCVVQIQDDVINGSFCDKLKELHFPKLVPVGESGF
jgi:hypothetical protein